MGMVKCVSCGVASAFDVLAHTGICDDCWDIHRVQLEAERQYERIRDAAPDLLDHCKLAKTSLTLRLSGESDPHTDQILLDSLTGLIATVEGTA